MKSRILMALVFVVVAIAVSSCAHRQYPASYHHGNNGQSRYY